MQLNFKKLGEGTPLIILHGVFGSLDNWMTLGRVFSETFLVYLVDQRNHGNSPHSDDFNYDLMVEDLKGLLDNEGLSNIHLLGHSMGGKVAMHFATKYPEYIEKLCVVDIAPKYYPPHHQMIFEGFDSVDLPNLTSRKEADEQLSTVIQNMGVRQFILKNLDRSKEGFQWKLNVEAIRNAIENIGEGLERDVSYAGETLFIAGGNSDYIQTPDHQLIKGFFPNATIEVVSGAGHWVHAEKPRELGELVFRFLS